MRVQYTNCGNALPREILNIKKLEAAHHGASHSCFDVAAVAVDGKRAGRAEEILPAVEHSRILKTFFIRRIRFVADRASVVLYLIKVGEYRVLTDLMRYDRNMYGYVIPAFRLYFLHLRAVLYHYFAVLVDYLGSGERGSFVDERIVAMHAVGTLSLDMTLRSVAHCVASAYQPVAAEAYAAEEVLLLKNARHELEVIRTSGVHFVREFRLVARDELIKALLAAPQLVAHAHHHKARVMSELAEHTPAFLAQELMLRAELIGDGSPERKLRL